MSACIFVHACMHNNVRKQTSADVMSYSITDATQKVETYYAELG